MGLKIYQYFTGGKKTYEEAVDAVVQGSGTGKNYDAGNSYRSKMMGKKLAGQSRKTVQLSNFDNDYYAVDRYEAQSLMDSVHTDALSNKVFSNSFFIICKYDGDDVIFARGLGIRQHEALILFHYVEHFNWLVTNRVCAFFIQNSSGALFPFKSIPLEQCCVIARKDGRKTGLAKVKLPSVVGMFKDISRDFIQDEVDFPGEASFLMLSTSMNNKIVRESINLPISLNVATVVGPGRASSGWTIYDGFKYPYQKSGYCGSMLLSKCRARPILLGMHTAGLEIEGNGIAEPIYNYYFNQEDSKGVPCLRENFRAFDLLDPEQARQQLDTSVTKIGCIPKGMRPRQSRETKIVKSRIFGIYKQTTAPVPLSASDPRLDKNLNEFGYVNPLFCGARKRGMVPIPFDPDILQLCYENLSEKIKRTCVPRRQKVGRLNIKQAVLGIDTLAGYDSIDMSSSEGYPWVLQRPVGCSNKKWLFDIREKEDGSEEIVGVFESLLDRIAKTDKLRAQGIIPSTVFQSCLKDERKKMSKIPKPGSTRLFELSPIDATLSHRILTQDFVAAYTNTRLNAEHAIGIDPDSIEWIKLYNRLTKHSSNILVADYSNFGPSLQFGCLQHAFDIICDWYTQYGNYGDIASDNLSRRVMAYEIGQCLTTCDDLLFQTHCGLPSGCTLTVYLNSLVNCLNMRYAYVRLYEQKFGKYSLQDFDKHVQLVVYGDDLIVSVSDEIIEWFNNATISKLFADYGIVYTDVTKGDTIRPFCKIGEATFLKRGFMEWELKYIGRPSKKIILAPLEKDVIREIANWTHVSENLDQSTLETSEASIRMMFSHGYSDFDYHFRLVSNALIKKKLKLPNIPSWNTIANECYPYEEIPPIFGV